MRTVEDIVQRLDVVELCEVARNIEDAWYTWWIGAEHAIHMGVEGNELRHDLLMAEQHLKKLQALVAPALDRKINPTSEVAWSRHH